MPRGPGRIAIDRKDIRAAEIVSLRVKGYTCHRIAEEVGISEGRVSQILAAEIDRRKIETAEGIEQIRAIELERLDQYTEKLQPKIEKGDPYAVQTALKVQERRSRLLGLDSALKIEAGIEEYTNPQLIAELAKALGSNAGTVDSGSGEH